ncbi:MAG: hypothetical protein IJ228_06560 [Succinivibrio sp.]|nr:hypothetical protein [Succinivibrio sp.]
MGAQDLDPLTVTYYGALRRLKDTRSRYISYLMPGEIGTSFLGKILNKDQEPRAALAEIMDQPPPSQLDKQRRMSRRWDSYTDDELYACLNMLAEGLAKRDADRQILTQLLTYINYKDNLVSGIENRSYGRLLDDIIASLREHCSALLP